MDFLQRHKQSIWIIVKISVAVLVCITGVLIAWASTFNIPDLQSFEERVVSQSTKIFDRSGDVLLHEVHDDVQRTVVPFDNISNNMIEATIAIEDSSFYRHHGIDPSAILRASWVNMSSFEFSQGGSTITQQVVKNSLLTAEKRLDRKIKEWILALRLEQEVSKDRILELYLNEVPYGGNLYGVEEAAQYYFDTSAKNLTVAQSAYLAALPKAPTYYSPYGNNRDALEKRKNEVLQEMYKNNFISKEKYDAARTRDVTFITHDKHGIKAPHFVFYVLEKLENRFGTDTLKQQGLRIQTSLDWDLQKQAQEIVTENAKSNAEKFNARNAGMVAVDPKTGEILTMVGSRNYFSDTIDGSFNVAIAERQPGSAFKPFVYASAFNEGYTPQTVVFDVKTQFSTACSPNNLTSRGDCYSPINYDGKFRGPITFRNALAQSVNIPAVKALYVTGTEDAFSVAKRMGLTSLQNPERYGLTLVLGGGEVTLLNMTSAYGVFANEGKRAEKTSILQVEDSRGNVIQKQSSSTKRQVIPKESARKISDILSDNQARAPAFGQDSYLHFSKRDVAAKTGTTNNYRDAWILGYTPHIAVGAWAGNNNNESMKKEIAGFIVAPMWNEFMQVALEEVPRVSFREPNPVDDNVKPILRGIWRGGESTTIDDDDKDEEIDTADEGDDGSDEEAKERISGGVHSILHWVDTENPRGPIPNNPSNDAQYPYWERQVQAWAGKNNIDNDSVTRDLENNGNTDSRATISLRNVESQTYNRGDTVTISASSTNSVPLAKVSLYVNNRQIGSYSSNNGTISLSFTIQSRYIEDDTVPLRLEFSDTNDNTIQKQQTITIE